MLFFAGVFLSGCNKDEVNSCNLTSQTSDEGFQAGYTYGKSGKIERVDYKFGDGISYSASIDYQSDKVVVSEIRSNSAEGPLELQYELDGKGRLVSGNLGMEAEYSAEGYLSSYADLGEHVTFEYRNGNLVKSIHLTGIGVYIKNYTHHAQSYLPFSFRMNDFLANPVLQVLYEQGFMGNRQKQLVATVSSGSDVVPRVNASFTYQITSDGKLDHKTVANDDGVHTTTYRYNCLD